MLTTDREKAICEKYSAYDKNNLFLVDMENVC